ncbi:hypothetical protein IT6_01730 [Methylacidiphilum caldifontis]|nr:hypothetical protein IT6_01730 [Methylacidiphilum caldifontis]
MKFTFKKTFFIIPFFLLSLSLFWGMSQWPGTTTRSKAEITKFRSELSKEIDELTSLTDRLGNEKRQFESLYEKTLMSSLPDQIPLSLMESSLFNYQSMLDELTTKISKIQSDISSRVAQWNLSSQSDLFDPTLLNRWTSINSQADNFSSALHILQTDIQLSYQRRNELLAAESRQKQEEKKQQDLAASKAAAYSTTNASTLSNAISPSAQPFVGSEENNTQLTYSGNPWGGYGYGWGWGWPWWWWGWGFGFGFGWGLWWPFLWGPFGFFPFVIERNVFITKTTPTQQHQGMAQHGGAAPHSLSSAHPFNHPGSFHTNQHNMTHTVSAHPAHNLAHSTTQGPLHNDFHNLLHQDHQNLAALNQRNLAHTQPTGSLSPVHPQHLTNHGIHDIAGHPLHSPSTGHLASHFGSPSSFSGHMGGAPLHSFSGGGTFHGSSGLSHGFIFHGATGLGHGGFYGHQGFIGHPGGFYGGMRGFHGGMGGFHGGMGGFHGGMGGFHGGGFHH